MAFLVRWGIVRTESFGCIVYARVRSNVNRKRRCIALLQNRCNTIGDLPAASFFMNFSLGPEPPGVFVDMLDGNLVVGFEWPYRSLMDIEEEEKNTRTLTAAAINIVVRSGC
jgi:hypothetical protein